VKYDANDVLWQLIGNPLALLLRPKDAYESMESLNDTPEFLYANLFQVFLFVLYSRLKRITLSAMRAPHAARIHVIHLAIVEWFFVLETDFSHRMTILSPRPQRDNLSVIFLMHIFQVGTSMLTKSNRKIKSFFKVGINFEAYASVDCDYSNFLTE
jgi:hypothetical protein